MSIGTHGKRLKEIQLARFRTAKECVKAMREKGFQISEAQFLRIKNGQWPTQKQVEVICGFFNVTPEWFMFGGDSSLLNELEEEDRKAVDKIIKQLIIRYRPPPR